MTSSQTKSTVEPLNNGTASLSVPIPRSRLCSLLVQSIIRRRLNNLSSAITNRLWLNAHCNYQCDVLITFPPRVDDYVLVWFLEKLLQFAPDIRVSIKYHFTTGWQRSRRHSRSFQFICLSLGVYGFYVTFRYDK